MNAKKTAGLITKHFHKGSFIFWIKILLMTIKQFTKVKNLLFIHDFGKVRVNVKKKLKLLLDLCVFDTYVDKFLEKDEIASFVF
jgi:hypothetical protein